MKKISRIIVEVDADVVGSERSLAKGIRRWIKRFSAFHDAYIVKGFNATMARERKMGKTEKTRFQAGRPKKRAPAPVPSHPPPLKYTPAKKKPKRERGKTRGIDRYV